MRRRWLWTDHRFVDGFGSSTDDWLVGWLIGCFGNRHCHRAVVGSILNSYAGTKYPRPSLHQNAVFLTMIDSCLRIATATNKPANISTIPQRDMLEVIVQVITHKSFAAIDSLFLILELPKSESVGRSRFCSTWKRPIAVRCFQPRIIPSIREEGDKHTEQGACRDVVNIVTIIFASRYCYQCCANKWC